MSIPKSFLLDIGGKELLRFEAVLDLLKCVEKENDYGFLVLPMMSHAFFIVQKKNKRK